MAIDGENILIGAYLEDNDENGQNRIGDDGSVYIFGTASIVTAPEIISIAADNPGETSIDMTIDINDGGESATYNYEVGTESGNYTDMSSTFVANTGGASDTFTETVDGLNPDTKYFARAYAENSAGATFSEEVEFWTVPEPDDIEPKLIVREFTSPTSLIIEFDPATALGAEGYLVMLTNLDSDPNEVGTPTDHTEYNVGDMLANSVLYAIVTDSDQTELEIRDLENDTNYDITIVPFNWNGEDIISANYNTTTGMASVQTNTPPVIEIIRDSGPLVGCFDEENRSISVVAVSENGDDLNFQWYKDDVPLVQSPDFPFEVNEAGILFEELDYRYSGIYSCDVWSSTFNQGSSIRSEGIVVFVFDDGSVTTQPQSQKVSQGESAIFEVDAHVYGNLPPEYRTDIQWYRGTTALENNDRISGARTNRLIVSNVDATDFSDDYWVMLSSYCSEISSSTVSLSEAGFITIDNDLTADKAEYCGGEEAVFIVEASSSDSAPITYEWYDRGDLLVGENSSTLTITTQEGVTHDIEVIISFADGSGQSVSSSTSIYAKVGANILNTFNDVQISEGQMQTITADVVGDAVAVEWFKTDDSTTPVATGEDFDLSSLLSTDSGEYYATASNDCRTVNSSTFTITVTAGGMSSVDIKETYRLTVSPNPTNSVAEINFFLDKPSEVALEVYDSKGLLIKAFASGDVKSGKQVYILDSEKLNLSSGVYYYNLRIDNQTFTDQIIIEK